MKRRTQPATSASPSTGSLGVLTPRQKEILRLIGRGMTNREVAIQLNISVRTVEVHRFNLMRRMDVRNVAQLLRQAFALKLLPNRPGRRQK